MIELLPEFFAITQESPWMPGLAAELAKAEWSRLECGWGLARHTYGTSRFVRRDRCAPRRVLGGVVHPAASDGLGSAVIEELDPAISGTYRAIGLEFAAASYVARANVACRLAAALAVVWRVPDLGASLGHLLGAIHILKPPGPDYDVSYSDPEVPFSVFLGVPVEPGPLDRLRLAEELVHECMHLQLTLLEARRTLVQGTKELHQSPWQGCLRPTRGVLHGFYVFAALEAFFFRLSASNGLVPLEIVHIMARRRQIAAELAVAAGALSISGDLTGEGRDFVAQLCGEQLKGFGRATACIS